MANPSTPPSHPHHTASGCTPQRTLIRFATLLGTFSLNGGGDDESNKDAASTSCAIQSGQALRSLLTPDPDDSASISSFPSLSLDSAAHHHHPADEPRSKVEGLASSNLARPCIVVARERGIGASRPTFDSTDSSAGELEMMILTNPNSEDDHAEAAEASTKPRHAFPVSDVALIPSLMMKNLTDSFALLIDARLRAYGTILTRHAASLFQAGTVEEDNAVGGRCDPGGEDGSSVASSSCILASERKLSALMEIGEDIRMDGVVTAFHVHSAEGDGGILASQEKKCGNKEVFGMPLVFDAVVDVSVPNLVEGERDRMTISIKAPGSIAGYFDEGSDHAHLRSVHVHMNTHVILASMIDEACTVVSKVIDNVNASSKYQAALASVPTGAELASDGGFPTEVGEVIASGSNENEEARVDEGDSGVNDGSSMPPPEPRVPPAGGPLQPSVVSPNLESTSPVEANPAPLTLSKRRRGSLTLGGSTPESAEKCAAIVDYVMGEVDEQSWVFPPLAKHVKTSHPVYSLST